VIWRTDRMATNTMLWNCRMNFSHMSAGLAPIGGLSKGACHIGLNLSPRGLPSLPTGAFPGTGEWGCLTAQSDDRLFHLT
jgi:hypothetical protein